MSERDLIEELQAISEDRHGAKNTHLLSWLEKGYFHCQHGSEEWCQGDYLDSARAYIERLEAVSKASLATIARLSEALAEAEKKGAEIGTAICLEHIAYVRANIRMNPTDRVRFSVGDLNFAFRSALDVLKERITGEDEGEWQPIEDAAPPRDLSQGGQHG